jgi:DNA (cytosine-5)-methyltransferase 1
MPTPKALDGEKGNLKTSQKRLDAGNQVDLPNVAIDLAGGGSYSQPLPPATGKAQTTADQEAQATAVSPPLLPTTRRSMGNASQPEVEAGDPKKRIENTVLLGELNWGKFEPAIRRWEQVLGRPAPAPTKPDGKDGAHRLSSLFTEWMMGLPEGWITGHGLSRNEELKMAGNGVVPQQAELALRILLDGISFEPVGGGASDVSDTNRV